jgi:hypothetical protein
MLEDYFKFGGMLGYVSSKVQQNFHPSFPEVSFSRIHRPVSLVLKYIIFKLLPPHLSLSYIHSSFSGQPTKTMNPGFTVFVVG